MNAVSNRRLGQYCRDRRLWLLEADVTPPRISDYFTGMPWDTAVKRALWPMVLGVALVWPGRVLHAFDGLPLDCVSKAVVLGVTFPMLWLLAPGFLNARWTRLAIVLLLAVKVGGSVLLTQQGLCARFSTTAPVHTRILTIPIDEPGRRAPELGCARRLARRDCEMHGRCRSFLRDLGSLSRMVR